MISYSWKNKGKVSLTSFQMQNGHYRADTVKNFILSKTFFKWTYPFTLFEKGI